MASVGHRCPGSFPHSGKSQDSGIANLWELRAPKEKDIDVTVMSDHRGDSNVCIHRDALDTSETMTRQGIRVTKPPRTLLDLASVVDERELERATRDSALVAAHWRVVRIASRRMRHDGKRLQAS